MTPDDCGVAALEVDGVDSNESMELAPAFELCFSSISKFVGGGTGTVRTWDKLDGSGAPRPSTTPAAVILRSSARDPAATACTGGEEAPHPIQ